MIDFDHKGDFEENKDALRSERISELYTEYVFLYFSNIRGNLIYLRICSHE